MLIAKKLYEKVKKQPAPYYYDYSLWTIITKPIRKWFLNSWTPGIPFNCIRILNYRIGGAHIGKRCFIGMHCYWDDLCYDKIILGDDVTISYGVYFACHGRKQGNYPIIIKSGAYVGMRSSVISKNKNGLEQGVTIGENAIVGACSLVNMDIPNGATAVGVPCRIIAMRE